MAGDGFVLGITTDRRSPGVQRRVRVTGAMAGLGTSAATVPGAGLIVAEVVLEAMTDGRITVTGTITAPFEGECRRCLERVEGDVVVDVQEVFERHPAPDAETYPLDGEHLDLEPMVRDAVLLALPLAPLCREGCAGPAPDAHPVVTEEHPAATLEDPRWSALKELRFE